MDILSFIGLTVGVGAILLGQFIEGGHIGSLLNGPAILIVGGGTIGAVMLQTPLKIYVRSIRMLSWMFMPPQSDPEQTMMAIVDWSKITRKEGLLGLERLVEEEPEPFARKGLQLLVDGNEPEVIRNSLEVELYARESQDTEAAKVYEGMGGYSPTIGIIGAVMGLIHVMGNLADPSRLGGGIAVAFVATIYGVGLANLIFLPVANKLKLLVKQRSMHHEMTIEGLVAIAEGENPTNIQSRLEGYFS